MAADQICITSGNPSICCW